MQKILICASVWAMWTLIMVKRKRAPHRIMQICFLRNPNFTCSVEIAANLSVSRSSNLLAFSTSKPMISPASIEVELKYPVGFFPCQKQLQHSTKP